MNREPGAVFGSDADSSSVVPRVALYLQDTHDLRQCIDHVQYAESRGFEAVWQSDSRFARDSFVALGAYAAATKRIRIGAGVVNPWTRHPAQIAAALLTLDDLAPGRVIGALGAWDEQYAFRAGIGHTRPLLALRETLTVLRDLLALKRVSYNGSVVHVSDLALDPRQRPEARPIPLYLGAAGLKTLALAGEIADGVLLDQLLAPGYNTQALAALDRGARAVGRQATRLDCAQVIVVSVDKDRSRAISLARRLVAQAIARQPALMRANGVPEDVLAEVAHIVGEAPVLSEGQIAQAMITVPDAVVQLITAAGEPAEVRARIADYRAAGCDCPVLFPLGADVRLLIDTAAVR